MHTQWTRFAASVVMLMTTAFLHPANGQDRVSRRDYALSVWVLWTITDDQSDAGKERAALYTQVKDFMNKARLGVPDDRIQYFADAVGRTARPSSGGKG